MDRDVRVKQFASALFSYVYRNYNGAVDLAVKLPRFNLHDPPEYSEDVGKAVLKMCRTFRTAFTTVFTNDFDQIKRSVQHFMTYLTSRCLKLCGDDLFMSFIVICAFIAELNLFCCQKGCYTFVSTGPKCFVAIFNRRLRKEFYSCGGWERLKLFCKNYLPQDGKDSAEDSISNPDSVQKFLKFCTELLEDSGSSDDEESSESDLSSMSEAEASGPEHVPHVVKVSNAQTVTAMSDDDESSDDSESSISEDKDSDLESSEFELSDAGVSDSDDLDSGESELSEGAVLDSDSNSQPEPQVAVKTEQVNGLNEAPCL